MSNGEIRESVFFILFNQSFAILLIIVFMNKSKKNINTLVGYSLFQAVWKLWPEVQFSAIHISQSDSYCDINIPNQTISQKDFDKIESFMTEILHSYKPQIKDISIEKAKIWAEQHQQKYLLDELSHCKKDTFWLYHNKEFEILINPSSLDKDFIYDQIHLYFKITKVGGVYWKNKAGNDQLQRLSFVVFGKQSELDNYLKDKQIQIDQDHRQIGKEQNLFMFSDLIGSGLPLWLADGATVRRQIENFIIDEEIRRGYSHVRTPDIASIELYKTSGHYPYYKDSMYSPIDIDGKKFMLRPMTCPHHFQIYKNNIHSYKHLPVKYAELAQLYRYEQSGELSGLTRVRTFTLADAHIICREDQAIDEISSALDLIEYVTNVFKLKKNKDYFYRLSLGDRSNKDKYYNDPQAWHKAEQILQDVLVQRKDKFSEAQDEAAFYGPKIDVQMIGNNKKEETAFTVQYDFVMSKRFDLRYVDENQTQQEPVVIHRSSVGAIERLFAFLVEFYKGRFPVWLAPNHIKILTVGASEEVLDHVHYLRMQADKQQIRVKIDSSTSSIAKKIKQSQKELIPYVVVLGNKEIEDDKFSVNIRSDLSASALSEDIDYSWIELLQAIEIDIDSKI